MLCSQTGQIKALKSRIKALEDKLAKGVPGAGSYKTGAQQEAKEEEEDEVDDKDEM